MFVFVKHVLYQIKDQIQQLNIPIMKYNEGNNKFRVKMVFVMHVDTHSEKKGKIDWNERDKQLRELCDKFRSKDGSYDVIVPGSGGKG